MTAGEMTDKTWPCASCTHLGAPDSTGFHVCVRPMPEIPALSRAQQYAVTVRSGPFYIGTPKQVQGDTLNDPIKCDTHESR